MGEEGSFYFLINLEMRVPYSMLGLGERPMFVFIILINQLINYIYLLIYYYY